jgi:hypothetical protein
MTSERIDIEDFIRSELILTAVDGMAEQASHDVELFNTLWEFVRRGEPKLSWRSCWILDHATENNTDLIDPILPEVYDMLNSCSDTFDGTVRHLLKFVLRRPVLEEKGGLLIDKCMKWLQSETVPTAIRANAAEYLYNIYLLQPDFRFELASVYDAIIERGASPGLENKLKKLRGTLK